MTQLSKKRAPVRRPKKSDEALARFYDARKNVDLYEASGHVPVDGPTTWVEIPTALVLEVKKFVEKKRKSA